MGFINFSSVISSVLSWAVIGCLGYLVVSIQKIIKHTKLMEASNKSLMRADLISRYQEFRDAGFCDDSQKDEFAADYALYHSLNGQNGYLDHAYEEILRMPNALPDV